MVNALETTICISVIAAAIWFAKGEYRRMRQTEQMNRALEYAVSSSFTAATRLAA